jgi:hypothetical protein
MSTFTPEQEKRWQIWSNQVQEICRKNGMNIIQIFKAFQACTNARDFFAKGGTPKACADQFLASIN